MENSNLADRKKFIKEKMDTKEGLDALFRYANEGILVTNSNGEIERINPSGAKMFCYSEDELIGKKIETLIPKRLAKKHVQDRKSFHDDPHPRSMGIGMNLFAIRKDGIEFPVEVSLSPFKQGGESFVIAFIIDITVRKSVEDEIRKKKEELEQLTRNLQDSNAELENFAYISSHDLQEPLRKIQSFGDRLKYMDGDKFSEKGKDYMERMLNASTRMQQLITDLLTFSRLSTRAQPFSKVNLNNILNDVISDLEIAIESSGTIINADKLPIIEAEPTQMRQLFQNLISNAIKFTNENKSPIIKISVKSKKLNGKPAIEIIIKDNGIGFDQKYSDKIFNIFQRLEGRRYEGSGIGLSICKKIANMHNGTINVKSSLGKGTSFIILLPVKHEKTLNYHKNEEQQSNRDPVG